MQQKNLRNIVCFYSKYSEHSKSLINTARSYKELELIHYVSIDSKQIRNIIDTDKIYTMQSVPCIFLIYNTQLIEKYEGLDAHKWLNEVINNIKNVNTPQTDQLLYQNTNSTANNDVYKSQPMQSQPMHQVTPLLDDSASSQPQPMQSQQKPQPMQSQQQPQPMQSQQQPQPMQLQQQPQPMQLQQQPQPMQLQQQPQPMQLQQQPQPMQSQSQPQPMQSQSQQQPIQSQPIQQQPQPIQSQPQPIQSQPMQSQPIQSQPQPMQSQLIQQQPQLPTPIPEHKKLPESSHNQISEHMARTMHAAEMAKQADDRRKQETGYEHSAIRPPMDENDDDDELPSKSRSDNDAKYARIDSIEPDEEQSPELIAAIMNRGQGAKQGEGNENGPPLMNSNTMPKTSNNTDIMALAKEMEKGR